MSLVEIRSEKDSAYSTVYTQRSTGSYDSQVKNYQLKGHTNIHRNIRGGGGDCTLGKLINLSKRQIA